MPLFDTPGTVSPVNLDFESQQPGHETEGAETTTDETKKQEEPGLGTDAETTEEETAAEELLLGKYKTVDDLAKAHESLQKRLGEMRNELGNLRQQAQPQQAETGTAAEIPAWTDAEWQQYGMQFQQEFTRNPGKAVFDLATEIAIEAVKPIYDMLQSQQTRSAADNAVNDELSFMLSAVGEDGQPVFPGSASLVGDIEDILANHSYLRDALVAQGMRRTAGEIGRTETGALETLYKLAKADKAATLGKEAYSRGLRQGQTSAQAKTSAALPKAGVKTQAPAITPEEAVVQELFGHKKSGFFI